MREVRVAGRTLFWNRPDRSHRLDSPLGRRPPSRRRRPAGRAGTVCAAALHASSLHLIWQILRIQSE